MNKKTMNMTEGSVLPLIVRFAIPLLLSTLFQQFYNLADAMVVSYNLGGGALAAVGSTSVIYTLILYFTYGTTSGFGIIISRAFGANDMKELRKTFGTMIVLNVIIAVVLTVLSLLFCKQLLLWIRTPADIYDQAFAYIFIVLVGLSTTILYNMCASFLRAVGNSVVPLIILLISCGINLALDAFFIIVLNKGVGGAALATVISQGISGFITLIYIIKNYKDYLPRRGDYRLEAVRTKEMITTGLSMALMLCVFQVGSIIVQRAVNELGTVIVTANTAARRLFDLLMLPLNTIATANATFVGQNYGAGKYARIREGMKKTIFLEIGWFVLSMLVAFPCGAFLMKMVSNSTDPVIMSTGLLYLRTGVSFFIPLGIVFVVRTTMQSAGHKIAPVVASVIELSVKIVSSYIIIPIIGYLGVALAEPISWCIMMIYLCIVFFTMMRKELM